jgi:predicted proteasome-type protease
MMRWPIDPICPMVAHCSNGVDEISKFRSALILDRAGDSIRVLIEAGKKARSHL